MMDRRIVAMAKTSERLSLIATGHLQAYAKCEALFLVMPVGLW
jgi:hypothetical protein